MDRRLDRRHQTNLAVTVTEIADPGRVASGQIVEISQSGISANISRHLVLGASVKVQLADCVLFGRVTSCDEEPAFRVVIEVVEVLLGESDLSRLVNAILVNVMPTMPGIIPCQPSKEILIG
jgi:hypothetical protein